MVIFWVSGSDVNTQQPPASMLGSYLSSYQTANHEKASSCVILNVCQKGCTLYEHIYVVDLCLVNCNLCV